MPDYITTMNSFKVSKDSVDVIKKAIEQKVVLPNGYELKVKINEKSKQIVTEIDGAKSHLNQIPPTTLIALGKALAKIRKWRQGLLPDFPRL